MKKINYKKKPEKELRKLLSVNICIHLHTSELYLNDQILPNTQGSKQKIYKYYSLQKVFDRNNHQCPTQPPQMRFWAAGSTASLYTLFQNLYPV